LALQLLLLLAVRHSSACCARWCAAMAAAAGDPGAAHEAVAATLPAPAATAAAAAGAAPLPCAHAGCGTPWLLLWLLGRVGQLPVLPATLLGVALMVEADSAMLLLASSRLRQQKSLPHSLEVEQQEEGLHSDEADRASDSCSGCRPWPCSWSW
jgi:hypothetical protein